MNTPTLPEWYANSTMEQIAPKRLRSGSGKIVRNALASFAESLARELSGQSIADRSWLSGIEPRAKILGIVALIVTATLLHDLATLGILLLLAVITMFTARITIKRFSRIWLGVPLFSLAIIIPALFNIITPGQAALVLWRFGEGARFGPWNMPDVLAVTYPGLLVTSRFLLRSTGCVTLAYLMIASTESTVLLSGLRRLGMPRVFGMVLAMMQRYLSVLMRAAEEIHLAKLSRTISPSALRDEHRWVASGIGSLFRRTHKLATQIHDAMLSRGYTGEIQTRTSVRFSAIDGIWIAGVIAVISALLILDYLI